MLIRTRHFKKKIASEKEWDFLMAAFIYYIKTYLRMVLFGRDKRTPGWVQKVNDDHRAKKTVLNFKEYILEEGGDTKDFRLINDSVTYTEIADVHNVLFQELEIIKPKGVVVEFGSGAGRNLLYLKSKYPDCTFIGLELSPVSVELSRQAAKQFNLDVAFFQCDVSGELPITHADIVYSFHALEQMPFTFQKALENMRKVGKKVYLFEPVSEFFPLNFTLNYETQTSSIFHHTKLISKGTVRCLLI